MPHERSNYGCWTCRVRKKKCDEKIPNCWACQSRGLRRHGYGAKPQWIDGAAEEKKEVDRLKQAVRESLKKRKLSKSAASQNSSDSAHSEPRNRPTCNYTEGDRSSHYLTPTIFPSIIHANTDGSAHRAPGSTTEAPLSDNPSIKDFEASLLMNYLDHVFPIQFSCYTPPLVELGRGWLLTLLTRTKPLYHAALALACLYRHSMLVKTRGTASRCVKGHWEQMNTYHTLSFEGLQEQISASRNGEGHAVLKDNVEILACIVQMISFELLRGGTESWSIHLTAASAIVSSLMTARKTQRGTASQAERLDCGERYEISHEIACDFLVGVSVWFDILGSASTRSSTFMGNNVQTLENIELENMMGCESRVMILIAQICQNEQWKRELEREGRLSILRLGSRGRHIESRLDNVLASLNIQEVSLTTNATNKHIPTMTKIFANAALIYLHTVVSGAHPALPEIKASVLMALAALSNLPDPKLLQNLVWPFCIIGCMSSKDHEPLFRSLLAGLDINEQCPGNYWKAFQVIQECWKMREEQGEACGEVDWTCAMKSLGFYVLLV